MKKTRVIIAAAMITTMLVGAGYASWTDKLTVNSTVSTGELNVKFTEYTIYQDYEDGFNSGVGNYATSTFKPFMVKGNVKNIDLTLSNMFPGVNAILQTRLENDGTIPAVIKSVTITHEDAALKGLNGKDLVKMTDAEKAKITVAGDIKQFRGTQVIKSLAVNTNLKDLQTVLNGTAITPGIATWKLEPNDSVQFIDLKFELPKDAVKDNEMENTYEKFKMQIDFIQHNQ